MTIAPSNTYTNMLMLLTKDQLGVGTIKFNIRVFGTASLAVQDSLVIIVQTAKLTVQ